MPLESNQPDILSKYRARRKSGIDNQFAAAAQRPLASKPKEETDIPEGDLTNLYAVWKEKKNPVILNTILTKLNPTINSALTSYGGVGNPIMKARAKQFALDSLKTYDPTKNTSLKSWVSMNLQGLRRLQHASSPLTLPERVKLDNYRLLQATDEFTNENNRQPTDDELSDLTGLSRKRINYVRKIAVPVLNEGQFDLVDGDSDSDNAYIPGIDTNEWQNIWAEYVYNDLDPIDKQIYDMRMGRGRYANKSMAVNEIAAALKLSSSAVSQRSNKIAEALSRGLGMEGKL